MSMLTDSHLQHRQRIARINAKAVRDEGIDLKRVKVVPELPAAPVTSTIEIGETPEPFDQAALDRQLQLVSDWLRLANENHGLSIVAIQIVVARYFGLSRRELISSCRDAKLVLARHLAMYFCRTLTGSSLPQIGRRFGGRDHTTVLNGVRRMTDLMSIDAAVAAHAGVLRPELEALA